MSDDMPELMCPVCGGAVDIHPGWRDRPKTPEGDPLFAVTFECISPDCHLWKGKVWLRESEIPSSKEAVSQCA